MALALRPQPDARAVIQPKPAALGLLLRYFQPFPPPDAVDPFEVDPPAFLAKQHRDPTVAIAAIVRGKPDDGGRQRILIIANSRPAALRRAGLPDYSARATLGYLNLRANVIDALLAAARA